MQVGRFVAGLDTAATGGEFQRADAAPRSSKGDGRLSVTDWVQTGRYAAALDQVPDGGGPTSPSSPAARLAAAVAGSRPLKVAEARGLAGTTVGVDIQLDSRGDENALGFSLLFDSAKLTFVDAQIGVDAPGGQFIVNDSQSAAGRIGILVALNAGQSFGTGARKVARLRFATQAGMSQRVEVSLTDTPVLREISDGLAAPLSVHYEPGGVSSSTSLVATPTEVVRSEIATQGYRLNIETVTGKSYRVEWSSDLGAWNTLTTFTSTGAAFEFLDAAASTAPRRFYRVVEQ